MNAMAESYYVKALGTFYYDMEGCMENLNYALSADPDHVGAQVLMGRFYKERLDDLESAEEHFQVALTIDPACVPAVEHYFFLLMVAGRFVEANRLLRFAKTLPTARKVRLLHMEGIMYEAQGRYSKALKKLKQAWLCTIDSDQAYFLNEEKGRLEQKVKALKKKASPKKKSKKKSAKRAA